MGIDELVVCEAALGEKKGCGSVRKCKELPAALPGFWQHHTASVCLQDSCREFCHGIPGETQGRQAVPGVVYWWTGLFDNPVSSAGSKRNVTVAVLLQDYRSPWATKPGWLVHSPALPSPQEGVGVLRKFSGDWVWDMVAESRLAPEHE